MTELQWKTIDSYNKSAHKFDSTIAQLTNYDNTYDYLIDLLQDGDEVLDLACGSGKISRYISNKMRVNITGVDLSDEMMQLAKKHLKDAVFYKESIIDFKRKDKYHAVIIGFGIPYLDKGQVEKCLQNAVENTLEDKYLYISFMNGNGSRLEKTSFGGACDFLLHYYEKDVVKLILINQNTTIIKEFELEYKEQDGSVTKDIVLIAKKNKTGVNA